MFYAYVYRHPETRTPMYVGKGCGARSTVHLRRRDAGKFAVALGELAKQGMSPDIQVIPALNEDHAYFLESCLIEVIGRADLGRGPLLNRNDGGKGSPRPSAEVRSKMSQSHLGIKKGPHSISARAKISATQQTSHKVLAQRKLHAELMTGRTASSSTKQKMSDSHKAKGGFSAEHRAAIKVAAQARGARQRAANRLKSA